MTQTAQTAALPMSYLRDGDPLLFSTSAKLVGMGVKDAWGGQPHDHWSVTITEEVYGGTMTVDYREGLGHRKANGRPEKPDTSDVLICIGSDLSTAAEMGADDGAAMDYLADELGMTGRPSEVLGTVRALRKTLDAAKVMLRQTGTDVEHFADWCRSLDV